MSLVAPQEIDWKEKALKWEKEAQRWTDEAARLKTEVEDWRNKFESLYATYFKLYPYSIIHFQAGGKLVADQSYVGRGHYTGGTTQPQS